MRRVCIFLFCLFPVLVAHGQLSGEDVLKKVEEHSRGVEDYIVQLDVTVDLERLKVPSMKVKMYFKQPDKVHYESGSFALLPKESIALNPSQLLERYTIENTRQFSDSGRSYHELSLRPKRQNTASRGLTLTVDAERWVPVLLSSSLPDGRLMSAEFTHEQVEGHWLPALLNVKFSSDAKDEDVEQPPTPTPQTRLPRKGSITIRYSEYRLNTGLSDEVFEKKEE
ncbi:MAG: hypothetical protein ACKVRP_00155 [Bacteroidota bacterium]